MVCDGWCTARGIWDILPRSSLVERVCTVTVHIKMRTSTVQIRPTIYDEKTKPTPTSLRFFAEVEAKIALLAAVGPEVYNSRQVVTDRAPTRPVKGLASAAWTLGRGAACRTAFRLDLPVQHRSPDISQNFRKNLRRTSEWHQKAIRCRIPREEGRHFDGANCVAVLHARDITTEQPRASFNLALGHIFLFPQCLQPVRNDHRVLRQHSPLLTRILLIQ